jgi:hypothetical protein
MLSVAVVIVLIEIVQLMVQTTAMSLLLISESAMNLDKTLRAIPTPNAVNY